jgi:hypothetical protein
MSRKALSLLVAGSLIATGFASNVFADEDTNGFVTRSSVTAAPSDGVFSAQGIVGTGYRGENDGIVGTGVTAAGIVGTGYKGENDGIVGTGVTAAGIVGTGYKGDDDGIVGTGAATSGLSVKALK